jgi:hypothetical protein
MKHEPSPAEPAEVWHNFSPKRLPQVIEQVPDDLSLRTSSSLMGG